LSPKYIKIVQEIKNQLTNGALVAGSKLPSVRQLSEEFFCSKNTVIKAYHELEKEHLIYAKPKSGYYIVNDFNIPTQDSGLIDFLSAGPDQNLVPYIEFQHCLNQAIETYQKDIFTYSDPQGFHSLRKEIVANLQDSQVFTESDRLVIVSGSQQAIHLLTALPFPNGKRNILIEQPTYFGMIETLDIQQATTFGIELSMNGIDLERLEYIFKNNDIKFFYIIPRFHNPLGHSYSNHEKKNIVELANKYDVYIVEDDFLGELDPDKKSDPLFSYDPSGRVIYIKSFSKVFLPGLRMASVVLPTMMIKNFLRYKFSADFNSSVLSQGALDIYLKSGMYHSHLKTIKEVYARKMQLLKQSCEEFLPQGTEYTKPDSGFYLSIYLPEHVSAKKLALLLSEEQILVDDTDRMFLPEYKKDNLIRLCTSQVSDDQMRHGVERIAKTITRLENKKDYYFHTQISFI